MEDGELGEETKSVRAVLETVAFLGGCLIVVFNVCCPKFSLQLGAPLFLALGCGFVVQDYVESKNVLKHWLSYAITAVSFLIFWSILKWSKHLSFAVSAFLCLTSLTLFVNRLIFQCWTSFLTFDQTIFDFPISLVVLVVCAFLGLVLSLRIQDLAYSRRSRVVALYFGVFFIFESVVFFAKNYYGPLTPFLQLIVVFFQMLHTREQACRLQVFQDKLGDTRPPVPDDFYGGGLFSKGVDPLTGTLAPATQEVATSECPPLLAQDLSVESTIPFEYCRVVEFPDEERIGFLVFILVFGAASLLRLALSRKAKKTNIPSDQIQP
jgi:hypothetical protein